MSSDEEDYMSDKFLAGWLVCGCGKLILVYTYYKTCFFFSVEQVRPGLVRSRQAQREIESKAKKAKIDIKPKQVMEQEKREEGLSVAISSGKGFDMLQRMGYKQGQTIGKTSEGIIEPIGISIKLGRGGLGREVAMKELNIKRLEVKQKRLDQGNNSGDTLTTEEYRKQLSQKSDRRHIEGALRNCQKACERLDREDKIKQPVLIWFWPQYDNEVPNMKTDDDEDNDASDDDDDGQVDYEPHEKLGMLTKFLRTTYNYCHWCGVRYTDTTDLMENCPGPDENLH